MKFTAVTFLLWGTVFLGGIVEGEVHVNVNSHHDHQNPLHRREVEFGEGELESSSTRDPPLVSEASGGGGVKAGLVDLITSMQQLGGALQQGASTEHIPVLPVNGPDDNPPINAAGVHQGLVDLLGRLQLLGEALQLNNTLDSHGLQLHSATTTTTPPAPITTTEPGNYLPCEEPYEEIAYRMCILQITDKKLSWPAAWEYCWSRGAVLVQDPVVVKTRRHLDQLYGESGSRVRWPIWVGGKEIVEGGNKVWKWADGSLVPQFLWNEGQPRHYSRLHAPLGSCMFLDGYKNFYASSLPCHLKRRFVCQRRE